MEEAKQREALIARETAVEAAKQALEQRLSATERLKADFDTQGARINAEVAALQKQLEQMADRMRELERALQLQAPGTAPGAR